MHLARQALQHAEDDHADDAPDEFDAVADFAETLADTADGDRLNPAYDSGDGIHPNDAGYQAMAQAVDLDTL